MRGLETVIDQTLVGVVPLVIDERLGLFKCRRQAKQIQVNPPDQCQAIRIRGKTELLFLQPGQHERIDLGPHTLFPDGAWNRRT